MAEEVSATARSATADVSPQVAVTIVCDVRPDRLDELVRRLAAIGSDAAANDSIPFGRLRGVHFARLLVTRADPAQLVYMSDVDGTVEEHVADLVDVAGRGLDAVLAHCEGWPAEEEGRARRIAYLLRRRVRAAAAYVNTIGRSLGQVLDERRLRDAIEDFLDLAGGGLPDDPERVRLAVRAFVAGRPELAPMLEPVPRTATWWRVAGWCRVAVAPLGLMLLLPLLLALAPIGIALVLAQERRDVPSAERPDPGRMAEIAALEDRGAQNPFCAVSPVKPGWLRAVMVRVALAATGFASRNVFNNGSLRGLRTIHFFRLVLLDGGRLMFGSTFDGSLESYMDDFVDRLARGLNAIFASAVGYPRTTLQLFGGAEREREFKDYVRVHQLAVPVFYSAYPDLTAVHIANNAAIRAGLSGDLSRAEAAAWARRL